MAYILLGNLDQLQLEIPTEGTKDWGTRLKDNFVVKIIEHDHTGNGKGAPLGISSFADNVINNIKIRLVNDGYLRSRNAGNTGDVNLIKANSSDNIVIGDATALQTTTIASSETLVNDLTVSGDLSIPAASIGTSEIENASVTADKLATDSVPASKIVNDTITQDKMALNSIGTPELIDDSVTADKLAAGAALANIPTSGLTVDKIANNSLDDTKIRLRNNQFLVGRNATNSADVNILRVNTSNQVEFNASLAVADGTITTAKLAPEAVTGDKINMATLPSGGILRFALADAIIDKNKLEYNALTSPSEYINTTGMFINTTKSPVWSVIIGAGVSSSTNLSMNSEGEYLRIYNNSGGSRTVRVSNGGSSLGVNVSIGNNLVATFYTSRGTSGTLYEIIRLADTTATVQTLS